MYVPAHFEPPTPTAVAELLANHGAADLITATPNGLLATLLPFVHRPGTDGRPDVLHGHVARNNPQWREPATGDALVIVRGPDAYVSPSWYASKAEHGRVVPTWNYVTAHIYGEFVVYDDPAWVERLVRELTAKHEAGREPGWDVDDAPTPFITGQLRAIVGVEIRVRRIQGKWKLSQNRQGADVTGVIGALRNEAPTVSTAMREARDAARS